MSAHQGERAAFEESARLAVEAISNIRTVASLRLEGALARRFDASLAAPYRDKDQIDRDVSQIFEGFIVVFSIPRMVGYLG